jgi:hypothetical protein
MESAPTEASSWRWAWGYSQPLALGQLDLGATRGQLFVVLDRSEGSVFAGAWQVQLMRALNDLDLPPWTKADAATFCVEYAAEQDRQQPPLPKPPHALVRTWFTPAGSRFFTKSFERR